MIRKILIGVIIVGIILSSIQGVILTFSDTLDGGVLSVFSIVVGFTLAIAFYFFIGKVNFPILVFCSVFFSTAVIAYTNHRFATTELLPEIFFVSKFGRNIARHSQFNYIELTKYTIDRDQAKKFNVGDPLILNTKEGYWGFTIINGLGNETF